MKLPDQADKYKMIRKVKHILAKWDQLLLTDLCDYRWVRTSHDYSLVYLPKGDFHGECYVLVVHSLEVLYLILP